MGDGDASFQVCFVLINILLGSYKVLTLPILAVINPSITLSLVLGCFGAPAGP